MDPVNVPAKFEVRSRRSFTRSGDNSNWSLGFWGGGCKPKILEEVVGVRGWYRSKERR